MRTYPILLILLILGTSLLTSCLEYCNEKKVPVEGVVTTISGEPIKDVLIKVGDLTATTDGDGKFQVKIPFSMKTFLINAEKFGYGLYSRMHDNSAKDLEIKLTQGTIVEIDPAVDNTINDTNSNSNIATSALLELDTSLLFDVVPKVYDHTGKLIDLGYPEELEGILDYLRTPRTSRRGMSLNIRGNSLRSASGSNPAPGSRLQVAVSTVDFFNPDGMPGDFTVRFGGDPRRFDIDTAMLKTPQQDSLPSNSMKIKNSSGSEGSESRLTNNDTIDSEETDQNFGDQLAYMESFGAATIEITDGNESYQLKEGMTATVMIPVYSIRLEKNDILPATIPLLHYNEEDGVWEVTGAGKLNESRDAYIGEVTHFSVVNFDMVKTGDSKCFKIRQMLVNGSNDNTSGGGGTGAMPAFRATLIVPQTSTSTFRERPTQLISEATGCVSVKGTALHGVSRIDDTVPYIVAIFSQDGSGATDTLNIAVVQADPINSIPAETAVASLGDCSSSTCVGADIANCESTNDAIDINNYSASACNTCWFPECPIIPFDNSGADPAAVVGIPMGGGDVNVKWVQRNTLVNSIRVSVHANDSFDPMNFPCAGTELAVLPPDLCSGGCAGSSCRGGSAVFSGTVGETVFIKVGIYDSFNCGGAPLFEICSSPVVIL